MTAPKKPKLVYVIWRDTVSIRAAWCSRQDAEQLAPVRCETIGWLIAQDKNCLLVARTVNACGEIGGLQCVPMECVLDWGAFKADLGRGRRK